MEENTELKQEDFGIEKETKISKGTKKLMLAVLVIGIVGLAVCAFALTLKPTQEQQPDIALLSEKVYLLPDRNSYGFPKIAGYDYFRQLPAMPKNFNEIKILYEKGLSGYTNAEMVAPEYYLQPEFLVSFPNWITSYKGQSTSMIGTYGTGFYQAEQWIYDLKKGETITASAFLFASAAIQYNQAITLDYSNKENFDVKITPQETILGRTYPEFEMQPAWIQIIKFEITPKNDANLGMQTIDLVYKQVSPKKAAEWQKQYGLKYIDRAGSPIAVPINLRFHVEVTT